MKIKSNLHKYVVSLQNMREAVFGVIDLVEPVIVDVRDDHVGSRDVT